ncbi:anti-sigma factor [Mesobacillus maritimus]|uniref:Anti-sigma factor n=1 Tax=Mesobacillus maritimus TaxID=1643336 RepID=A0ABS7K7U6_9BACI|nr:anti-sigma factor [Mesobacillus maritimus]MBY0098344.1 anti-sigma factor [Mesobacillus maritimus]
MEEWNKEKEKKIMFKYRFTLTVRVIRVLVACLFLFWVYMFVVTISYNALHLDKKHAYYSKLAMDWTNPNLDEEFGEIIQSEITPFLTQKISYPVSRMVGKEPKVVGEMEIKKTLLNMFSTTKINFYQHDKGNKYRFFLPEHPKSGEPLGAEDDERVWEQLEKIHEGTVAELGFSTSEFMTAEELLELLEPYDLDLLWAPLYTGEFKEFEPTSYGGGGSHLSIQNIFGLSGGREISNDYMSEGKIQYLDEDLLADSKQMMLENMKTLLEEESNSYIETFLGLHKLEERYHYLKNNEFTVYGAVVTGPVKELLKLKKVENIRGAQLGEMGYWNWE